MTNKDDYYLTLWTKQTSRCGVRNLMSNPQLVHVLILGFLIHLKPFVAGACRFIAPLLSGQTQACPKTAGCSHPAMKSLKGKCKRVLKDPSISLLFFKIFK
ncbi:hypothetical protein GOODEAATRI_010118 [Goodea atripinnis]|uniref:Uncharacterized protein n=1 Tax=Goodea atripinnis TaxID=208336 RepID=A0ABV0PWU2_9TELE